MKYRQIKRLIDILFSLVLCPFVGIVIVFSGFFIAVDDGLPVFYNSERRGRNGKVFKMYKLRSMKKNSEDLRNNDGSTYNSSNDPRLTKVGKIIRKYSIDELPQIFNVLIGNMSFVGPRPSIVSMDYELLDERRKKRLTVAPGITGYSQAFYRNSISQEEKIENDCWYVDHLSFKLDCKVIAKTIVSALFGKNIYNNNFES